LSIEARISGLYDNQIGYINLAAPDDPHLGGRPVKG
jgi:hypothetical protein